MKRSWRIGGWNCLAMFAVLIGVGSSGSSVSVTAAAERPNVVVIMTDNHGAWTLGCYGNPEIRTPHIDRLAAEGTLFTRAFANNPVCSPTRATFLTGLMPSQHGVHCFLRGGRLQVGPEARNTLAEFTSLPEILKQAGYRCGLVGKWHLGDNLHPQEGFDDYWITMPHGGTSTFYDAPILEGGQERSEPQYLTDFWTRHAVQFIDQHAGEEQPFFLFLTYNGPYSLGRLLLQPGRNRHAAYYADKDLKSFPDSKSHPWQFSNLDYHNNPVSEQRVATEVSGVDDGVGTILETLRRHQIDDDTLIVFLADQGWVGGHGGFFGMGDHTRPLTAREGMMQIPLIVRHPGRVAAGRRSAQMVSGCDLLPTILDHLQLAQHTPTNPPLSGQSFAASWNPGQPPELSPAELNRPVYYEIENLRCVRTDRWKYIHRFPNGPHELYDLQQDPDEFNNLATSSEHRDQRKRLNAQLTEFFDQYAEPKYDLWQGGGSQSAIFDGIDEELAQVPPVDPPQAPADFEPVRLDVPEGFEVELAAAPPLVAHPTMACFDDRGRLYVAENAGVNLSAAELEQQLPNSVRQLVDTDGDGRFDRSTVFADRMTFPMGAAWHDGALYVASPPHIWRLRDTDDDGVADERQILVGKFGYTGNAASIHGCFLGPDGRMYWCDGYHGHEFRDESGDVTSQREGSYLFSCRPDGSDVRIHCGGGMDNPVELDFLDSGDVLGTVNILYSRPRSDCLVHWLYGGAYPHRERVLNELKTTGDWLRPTHDFGHVAVSGTARYRSGVLDHRWRDNMFVTFFNVGKVVRVELEREGATYKATQREFLASQNRDFHPTDVLEDADGSLLVVDTGGWFYRGCPTSQTAKPDILGGIYRVRRKHMTTQVDPRGLRIDWDTVSANQLMNLLNDTRHAVRERAIAECARRPAGVVAALATTVSRRDIRARLNAVWALTRIVGNDQVAAAVREKAQAAIRLAINDRAVDVRQAACRSLATYSDPGSVKLLEKALTQDVAPVRREAAKALGRLRSTSSVEKLLAATARAGIDRAEEHALIYALIEINDRSLANVAADKPHPQIQRAALIALDQMDGFELTAEHVARWLDSDDAALRLTAARIAVRRHQAGSADEWAQAVSQALQKWLSTPQLIPQRPAVFSDLIRRFAGQPELAALIGQRLREGELNADSRELILDALADGTSIQVHPNWVEPLVSELQSGDVERVERAVRISSGTSEPKLRQALNSIAADVSQSAISRVSALEALAGNSAGLKDQSFQILIEMLTSRATASESSRAAQILGSARLTPAQAETLLESFALAGPLELSQLMRPFGRPATPALGRRFLTAVEQAPALPSLRSHEFSDIIKRYPAELLPQANRILDQLLKLEQSRLQRLDDLQAVMHSGRPDRGREVFFSKKAKCSTCHVVGREGKRVGPDLTTIGSNRTTRDLLESIVFPSATIVRQYESYTVLLDSGRVVTGMLGKDSPDEIELWQQTGESLRIARSQIEQMTASPISIMPQGLDQPLSNTELADLVSWLQSLKRAP